MTPRVPPMTPQVPPMKPMADRTGDQQGRPQGSPLQAGAPDDTGGRHTGRPCAGCHSSESVKNAAWRNCHVATTPVARRQVLLSRFDRKALIHVV